MPNWKTCRQQSKKSQNAVYQNSSIWKWIQIENICCCAVIKIHSCITDLWSTFSRDICWDGEKEPQPKKGRQTKKAPPVIKKLGQTWHQPRAEMKLCSRTQDRDLLPVVAAVLAIISTLLAGLDAVAVTHLGYHHTAGEILLWTTVCSM